MELGWLVAELYTDIDRMTIRWVESPGDTHPA
jgi:hypothetical protein